MVTSAGCAGLENHQSARLQQTAIVLASFLGGTARGQRSYDSENLFVVPVPGTFANGMGYRENSEGRQISRVQFAFRRARGCAKRRHYRPGFLLLISSTSCRPSFAPSSFRNVFGSTGILRII